MPYDDWSQTFSSRFTWCLHGVFLSSFRIAVKVVERATINQTANIYASFHTFAVAAGKQKMTPRMKYHRYDTLYLERFLAPFFPRVFAHSVCGEIRRIKIRSRERENKNGSSVPPVTAVRERDRACR